MNRNDPNFISRLAGEPVVVRVQTVATYNSFHPTEPTFFSVPAFLTGKVDRSADGIPIKAEVAIAYQADPDQRVWVPCDVVLYGDGSEPVHFVKPANDDQPMTAAECDAERMKLWIACAPDHKYKTYRNGACICESCHAKVDALEKRYEAGLEAKLEITVHDELEQPIPAEPFTNDDRVFGPEEV